jgi:hypothetical protein
MKAVEVGVVEATLPGLALVVPSVLIVDAHKCNTTECRMITQSSELEICVEW